MYEENRAVIPYRRLSNCYAQYKDPRTAQWSRRQPAEFYLDLCVALLDLTSLPQMTALTWMLLNKFSNIIDSVLENNPNSRQ